MKKPTRSDSVAKWIALGVVLGLTVLTVVRAWRKRSARARELAREQQDFADRLEKSIRDLNARVSELTRSRI